jgi:hypothetical protein
VDFKDINDNFLKRRFGTSSALVSLSVEVRKGTIDNFLEIPNGRSMGCRFGCCWFVKAVDYLDEWSDI